MPILYIHGVATRSEGDLGWKAVRPFVAGVEWPKVQSRLRGFIAPLLSEQPEKVSIEQVFWGDLGSAPTIPERQLPPPLLSPANLSVKALADALERHLRQAAPLSAWPLAVAAAGATARDPLTRHAWLELPPEAQWEALHRSAEQHLRQLWAKKYPSEPRLLLKILRHDLRQQLMGGVMRMRGPLEDFMPYFVGDVLTYSLRRGSPQQAGAIQQRVLEALAQAHRIKQQTGEPLVVLTHSMGGQIMYDALSTFAPVHPSLEDLQVDFWAAAASQLSLYASLGLFAQPTPASGIMPPLTDIGYLWNVWSPTDLLSFQAAPVIPEASDIRMPLTQDIMKAHLAYLIEPLFYQIFAAKLRGHLAGQP